MQLFLEARADGGVACGLPRTTAQELAVQMVLGSCRLLTKSESHPARLKDAVCSPGGTSIQGVRALERMGFRSAVIEAVIAACEKDRRLAAAPIPAGHQSGGAAAWLAAEAQRNAER